MMKNMKRLTLMLSVAVLAVLMAACHSSQSTLNKADLDAAKQRYETALDRNFDFDYLSAKAKYAMGSTSLSGRMYVHHGQWLCLTATVFGIEVARVEATPDQVTVVDKFDKIYTILPLSETIAKLGLENEAKLEAVEALLLGRIFVPGKGEAADGDFRQFAWDKHDDGTLEGSLSNRKYTLSYTIDRSDNLSATSVSVPAKGATVSCAYSNPVAVGEGAVPGTEVLSGKMGSQSVSVNLSLSSVAVSKKGWNAFKPTSAYREVTITEMIKAIKELKN